MACQRVEVAVRVPASSANMGPGFDALGVALGLYNWIGLRVPGEDGSPAAGRTISEVVAASRLHDPTPYSEWREVQEGAECLMRASARRVFEAVQEPFPPLSIFFSGEIPMQRGLGSSSSVILGGLVGANALLGNPFDKSWLLTQAAAMDGHPDNVAPALLGGVQIAYEDATGVHAEAIPLGAGWEELRFVVCVPESPLATAASRRALPATVPHADAAFNVGRAALLVACLASGDWKRLGTALEDRLHQPYRATLMPGFMASLAGAQSAGAYGACLSGSGSAALAFASPDTASAVASAMEDAFASHGVAAKSRIVPLDHDGAIVV